MRPKINFVQSFDFKAGEEEDNKLFVSGFSVHEGIFQNGTVEIPNAELKNIKDSLVGVRLMKDHSRSVDDIVGRIQETRLDYDEEVGKAGVRYLGYTYDEQLNKKIKQQLIDNVSIGFTLTPICSKCGEDFRDCAHFFDEAHIVAKDVVCHEQSFVTLGADSNSTVAPQGYFSSAEEFLELFPKEKESNKEYNYTYSFTAHDAAEIVKHVQTLSEDEGEKMKMEELEKKLAEQAAQLEELTGQVTELSSQKDALQKQKEEFESTIESQKEVIELQTQELEKGEQEKKVAFCKEIVTEEVSKGITQKEKFDERVEKLAAMSQEALDAIKETVEAAPKITGTPGQFGKQEGNPYKPVEEFDAQDGDAVKKVLFAALKYPGE